MTRSVKTENELQFAFDSVPNPGESRPVCPGINWVRLPLPFALNHVNCWLLGETGEQVLVDTGVDSKKTRELWQQTLSAERASMSPVMPQKLLVTHFHPDHMGLAGWFKAAGVELLGSEIETAVAQQVWSIDDSECGDLYAKWYASNGLPDRTVDAVRTNGNGYRKIVGELPVTADWGLLIDGQWVELGGYDYRVIVGGGHAPDMLMLYRASDRVLIAADQVLPSISPNVSVMPHLQDPDPLDSFLKNLQKLKDLPADTLVLPSHGTPFRGLATRINVLSQHHELRLAEVLAACERPRSPFELFDVLFRRELDAQQTSFALGESLAHLRHLEHQGVLQSDIEGGVTRFLCC